MLVFFFFFFVFCILYFVGVIFRFTSFIFGFAKFLGLLDLGIHLNANKLPGNCCSVMICAFRFLPISLFVILGRGSRAPRPSTGRVRVQPKKPVYYTGLVRVMGIGPRVGFGYKET